MIKSRGWPADHPSTEWYGRSDGTAETHDVWNEFHAHALSLLSRQSASTYLASTDQLWDLVNCQARHIDKIVVLLVPQYELN
jgi:hypothetical protein